MDGERSSSSSRTSSRARRGITFWAGQRFYDRYNIDSQDYFWLSDSGYGGGVYDIPLGPGKLAFAYIGGIQSGLNSFSNNGNFNEFDLQVNGGQGFFYRHTLDLRYGDIDFLYGKLKLVLLGSYEKGGNFTTTTEKMVTSRIPSARIIQQWDLPKIGPLSYPAGASYGGDSSISTPTAHRKPTPRIPAALANGQRPSTFSKPFQQQPARTG